MSYGRESVTEDIRVLGDKEKAWEYSSVYSDNIHSSDGPEFGYGPTSRQSPDTLSNTYQVHKKEIELVTDFLGVLANSINTNLVRFESATNAMENRQTASGQLDSHSKEET